MGIAKYIKQLQSFEEYSFSWGEMLSSCNALMEHLDARECIHNEGFRGLQKEPFYSVLLTPKKSVKAGKTGNRWKVDVNIKLDKEI